MKPNQPKSSLLLLLWVALAGAIIPARADAPVPLTWEGIFREVSTKPGQTNVPFAFNFTNTSPAEVVITAVRPSCGCTTTKIPTLPWKIESGKSGVIEANVDIHGKQGTVRKVITVESSTGTNILTLSIKIPADRERNMKLAQADRQAVFKGDCVTCHVTPTIGRIGAGLYGAACGICHESDHRADMVPNLKHLAKTTDLAYWKSWITHGKEGSLMPAFAASAGGPLNEAQIDSLAEYLAATFIGTGPNPSASTTSTAPPAKAAPVTD